MKNPLQRTPSTKTARTPRKFLHRSAAVFAVAVAVALVSPILPAGAQQEAESIVRLEKVEVTGSHIARTEIESALPVQVITREDIDRSGSTTVAEMMAKVSANIVGMNDRMSSLGAGVTGLSSVNLRGIGDGSTLVLLNGRRVANYAFDGGAVDVNSIPLSAVERIEILKDGASAIYGADAIAGVVNFILRKDFQGLEATAYGGWTEHGGGNQAQAIVTAGYGDLAKDRFNVFATLSYQKDQALSNTQRPYTRTGYLPDEGVIALSPITFPANIRSTTGLSNPSYANGCAPPLSLTIPDTTACGYDFATPAQRHSPGRAAGGIRSRRVPAQRRPPAVRGGRLRPKRNDDQGGADAGFTLYDQHRESPALSRGRALLPDRLCGGQRDFRRPQPVLPSDPAWAASHRHSRPPRGAPSSAPRGPRPAGPMARH